MKEQPSIEPIESWEFYRERPLLISGPCGAESLDQIRRTAVALSKLGRVDVFRAGIWKPRSRPGGFDGVGRKGLSWLVEAREETGLPLAVEVAAREHVRMALDHGIDLLWIGARTTANPFAVQQVANALRGAKTTVLVKNPVSPDVELWVGAIERIAAAGIGRIAAVHRGFSSHAEARYRNAPHWQIPVELMRRMPGLPMLCDPSHLTGDTSLIFEAAQEAMDLDYDGLMIESHIDPKRALCDSRQQLGPEQLGRLLAGLVTRASESGDDRFLAELTRLRMEIDDLDHRLLDILEQRMRCSRAIASRKKENNVAILQTGRWDEIIRQRSAEGVRRGLDPGFVAEVFREIHQESIDHQRAVMNTKTEPEGEE